jgi:hypothetical protein
MTGRNIYSKGDMGALILENKTIRKINTVFLYYNIIPWVIALYLLTGSFGEGTAFTVFFLYTASLLPGVLLVYGFVHGTGFTGSLAGIFAVTSLAQVINFILLNGTALLIIALKSRFTRNRK